MSDQPVTATEILAARAEVAARPEPESLRQAREAVMRPLVERMGAVLDRHGLSDRLDAACDLRTAPEDSHRYLGLNPELKP